MENGTKTNVVIGILGTTLDRGPKGHKRWERWRPTVSLFQNPNFKVNRLELLFHHNHESLATRITKDIATLSEAQVQSNYIALDDPWDFEKVYATLHDFAINYPFDTDKENYFIHISTGSHIAQICLFLLTEARFLPAKLIQTSPPKDGEIEQRIIDLNLSKYDRIEHRIQNTRNRSLQFLKSGIATKNEKFNTLIQEMEHVALHSNSPILLSGPTGAGKTQLARKIFELKKDRHLIHGEFVELNCATLRGDTVASTLFGHKKGSFTGAHTDRAGLLSKADKGLLFLDEIGEMGLDEQAMLLRALEDKSFLPMGSDTNEFSDFQLLAGTNKDLRLEVEKGCFRADLYARLNLWHFDLPGLFHRQEDIEPNLEYELEEYSAKNQRQISFTSEARTQFLDFAHSPNSPWKGNFRDLNAAVERMATFAPRGKIFPDTVQREIDRLAFLWQSSTTPQDTSENIFISFINKHANTPWDELDLFDQNQLCFVLEQCLKEDNLAEVGRKLFSNSRTQKETKNDSDRVRKYLKKFGIDGKMIKENLS